ncbi:hypothetical protein AJ80_03658 [Polytolypa hystricis UAMH7299]|uniref:AMP-dependent synthetase/ligase domain-containing protein n=1 Tax=Polytolypa hystricis (strain UAMH7299) TaxID=1447883 RepID=A0A2B7YFX4_POLH7|nr:hypothetical protein AJ80_03658 [Polytolypa hystricis UAMH7299]
MPKNTMKIGGKEVDIGGFDRMDFVPFHEGPDVLPHDLIFHALHALAMDPSRIAIIDCKISYQATYRQLLSDIVLCRNRVREALAPETLEALQKEQEVSLLLWSEGYEFTVAFFAILALGAIVVPFSPHITVPEALHNCKVVAAHGILTSSTYVPHALKLQASFGRHHPFNLFETTPLLRSPAIDTSTLKFQSGRVFDQNRPAVVIFTSGSTGPPKGVAVRRYNLFYSAYNAIRSQGLNLETKVVQFLPTHHATGLLYNTIPTLVAGGCVEFDQGSFNPAGVWERIRSGDLKRFSAVPTIYVRLLRHWDSTISKLPENEEYRAALSKIVYFASSTSPVPRRTLDRWLELSGKPISDRYGGSEFGNVYVNRPGDPVVPGSVGVKNSMSESKLSEGDRGEVLVRGPMVFSKYMNDPVATINAFDEDGFYKTGDIARREGDVYFIEGRRSVDILKSGGYKISALDIEKELNSHDKVAEGIIVGVDDEEFGQRIAAAVVLKNPSDRLTLAELREDLRESLSNYKLPTMLRVVPQLKKTSTLKIPKILIKEELFGAYHPDIEKWNMQKSKNESKL